PTKEMIDYYLPELMDELRGLDPVVIVALGGTAAQLLCKRTDGISRFVGAMTWNEDLERFVIPTFHPSYILRDNYAAFDDLYNCLSRAVRVAQGKAQLPPPGGHKIDWELIGH